METGAGWQILKPLILLCAGLCVAACSAARPDTLGLKDGRLAPCPSSPNCVSSQSPPGDHTHFAEPLGFTGTAAEARRRLLAVLETMPRVKIVQADERYIRAEFTSAIFRFVDDVEFLVDEPGNVIHVRSASRVGYSDLGVNRKRVDKIRRLFEASGIGKP